MFSETCKFIDLSHLLTTNIPQWDATPIFKLENNLDYTEGARVQSIEMPTGIGTHIDAPSHFIKGGLDIPDISLENLFVPVVVIDVSEKADEFYQISVSDIQAFEKAHGIIPENSLVVGFTGWSRFWPDEEKYANRTPQGIRQFPSFSKESAAYLIEKKIAGIGIDTLSVDCDESFSVHHLILSNNCYIVENLSNCHLLPPIGAQIVLLPLNIKNATESPIRAVALVPNIKK